MYQQFFNLKEMPFSLSPDTSYFFAYGHYANALNTLMVALRSGEGFIKVTGEVGTGKTLLCRKIINALGDKFKTLYIPNPQLSAYGLQAAVAEELGISITRYVHRLQKKLTDKLIEYADKGRRVVLIIDEAQAMPEETLESLRLLTNLETEKFKLLHVVMFGQPELDELINRRSVRQLKQRITFSYNLEPIDRAGMNAYIMHRLIVAGHNGGILFNDRALQRLYTASRGIPRLINILCHKALMVSYGQGLRQVNESCMALAIKDTEDSQLLFAQRSLWRRLMAGFAAVVVISVTGVLTWNY